MIPKFREPIPPGLQFAWMANARKFILISAILSVGSILVLTVKGLDKGIDFKGGTKVIVGFTEQAGATPDKIRSAVGELITAKLGKDSGQIEVQGFNVGDKDAQGRKIEKYQVYTELTTLLPTEKADATMAALKTAFGPETRVDRPEETDKLLLTLADAVPVNEGKEKIRSTLTSLGFQTFDVLSDEERAYDMDFFKEYNLTFGERVAAGEKIADDDYEKAYAEHQAKKTAALGKRTDRMFTIELQQIQSDMEEKLAASFGKENVVVESATAVSASVGADLFSKGLLALLYSIIGIVIYVGLRFDFRFGPGAVISLLHDALITLGIFSLFGMKFTLPIVSAILTIIGYSVNDTIVVYDRIRENQERLKGLDFIKQIDISLNETLSRTVLTGGSALLVTLSLMFLGGGLISDFAFALAFGIVIGTYSSIAVAVPFTLFVEDWQNARKARALGKSPTPSAT